MAQVTVLKVVEGQAHIVIRVYLVSDGSGELVNYPILLPSDLNPPRPPNKPTFRLMQIWGSGVWFDISLSCGTLSPVPILTFARDCDFHMDFRCFGGLLDQNVYAAPPVVDDGALLLSTNNFVLGSQGSYILELRKTNE